MDRFLFMVEVRLAGELVAERNFAAECVAWSFVEQQLSEGRDVSLRRQPGRSGDGTNRSGSAPGEVENA